MGFGATFLELFGQLTLVASCHQCVCLKIFSHGLRMLFHSLLGLAASVVDSTTSLVAPTCSLQLLVYVYFVVAAMPHLSEALTSCCALSRMAIS